MRKKYDIQVDCANCALKMEDAVKKVDGVNDASVNYLMQKLTVDFDDGLSESKIIKSVIKACRKVEPDFEMAF